MYDARVACGQTDEVGRFESGSDASGQQRLEKGATIIAGAGPGDTRVSDAYASDADPDDVAGRVRRIRRDPTAVAGEVVDDDVFVIVAGANRAFPAQHRAVRRTAVVRYGRIETSGEHDNDPIRTMPSALCAPAVLRYCYCRATKLAQAFVERCPVVAPVPSWNHIACSGVHTIDKQEAV